MRAVRRVFRLKTIALNRSMAVLLVVAMSPRNLQERFEVMKRVASCRRVYALHVCYLFVWEFCGHFLFVWCLVSMVLNCPTDRKNGKAVWSHGPACQEGSLDGRQIRETFGVSSGRYGLGSRETTGEFS